MIVIWLKWRYELGNREERKNMWWISELSRGSVILNSEKRSKDKNNWFLSWPGRRYASEIAARNLRNCRILTDPCKILITSVVKKMSRKTLTSGTSKSHLTPTVASMWPPRRMWELNNCRIGWRSAWSVCQLWNRRRTNNPLESGINQFA